MSTFHSVPHPLSALQLKSKPVSKQSQERPQCLEMRRHLLRTCGPQTPSEWTSDNLLNRKVITTQQMEAVLGKHFALHTGRKKTDSSQLLLPAGAGGRGTKGQINPEKVGRRKG